MRHGTSECPVAFFSEMTYEVIPHHHDEYEIFYLAAGKMKFGVGDHIYYITAGDILFIEPMTTHYAVQSEEGGFHYFAVVFSPSLFGGEDDPCRKTLESIRVNRYITLGDDITSRFDRLCAMYRSCDFGWEIALKSMLFTATAHIIDTEQYIKLSDLNRLGTKQSSDALNIILKYIEEHYKERITLEEILTRVPYSKSHLMRIFKYSMGMSIVDYVNKYRVEKACLELLYTGNSITDIAISNGFNTVQYFSKTFRTFMNCTPSKFRGNSGSAAQYGTAFRKYGK